MHQETVHLRFGQGVGTLLLHRILRRHNHEQWWHLVRCSGNRYLPFFHRLKHCGLDFRRRAIDLVAQHDVRENRAGLETKLALAVFLVIHLGARHIGWQQVGRELDATEVCLDVFRERLDGARFCQARQTLNKEVTVGQQADDNAFDHVFLADDRLLHALPERFDLFLCHSVYFANTSVRGDPAEPDGGLISM